MGILLREFKFPSHIAVRYSVTIRNTHANLQNKIKIEYLTLVLSLFLSYDSNLNFIRPPFFSKIKFSLNREMINIYFFGHTKHNSTQHHKQCSIGALKKQSTPYCKTCVLDELDYKFQVPSN